MKIRLCPVTGKRQFTKCADAKKNVAWFQSRRGCPELTKQLQAVYRCPDCGKWHATSYDNESVRKITASIKRHGAKRQGVPA